MADRKQTPDILGGLLGDRKPKTEEKAQEKAQDKSEDKRVNTIKPEYHKDSKPVKQQARKPVEKSTGKMVSQKPQKSDKTAGEATDDSGEASGEGLENKASGEKLKATYYLAIEAVEALEEGWYQLRKMASTEDRTGISKSLIVETALQMALEELEKTGQKSRIAKVILGEKL
jgi:hypothetical protein